MIAVAVSSQNHCFYCLTSHGAVLRVRSGDEVLADTVVANYRADDLTSRQRAMFDFAVKITLASDTCSDEDIMDIIQVAGFFNYSNRVANTLELRPNREFHSMAREASPKR
ncbi:MAG: alkylhydroperoxidase [Chloroflexi bacterium AL-W]|nr:alkylhydroperoxidase [Chloroflexi bacterium AL-N1]NOK67672.1 alkylhydroperoxidase [Chloroflexi bacterium AL-N10]NOK75558.1 alkylhydroperoxidase [Chloroflexi bacterium AL-N5]NOK82346.1 alkylhydroperoxidase [Chloroflexi bacterium AL-W]NOK90191.1 alkylhydroperoxidase [Chloroflexi bacterium AL-N15]